MWGVTGCGRGCLTFFVLVKHRGLVGVVPAHIPQLPPLLHARPRDVRSRILTGLRDAGCSWETERGMRAPECWKQAAMGAARQRVWREPIAAQGWGPCGHPFFQGAPQLRSPHSLSPHPVLSMTYNALMETRGLPKSRSPHSAAHNGDEEEQGGRGERREGGRAAGGGGVDPDLSQELEATAPISQSGGRGLRRKGPPWSSWVPGTPHP